jgi:integrase
MPVYKEENGTYTVRFYADDKLTGKRKQIRKRGFKTRREAVQWEAKAKAENMTTTSSATFWDIFQRQLDNNDTSLSTRSKKEAWISTYFAEFVDLPIDKISKADLVQWRNSLKESGLAVRTLNCGLQYVRSVFGFYNSVYGGQNPAVVLKSFKLTKADKTEMKIWTPEQFQQFAEAVENPMMRAFFTFLYWTGCRRGEAIAITADCFQGNKVHIFRSMKHFKNGFQPLKTDSSERTITVDSATMAILEPWIQQADPFVFGGVTSLAITTIDRAFREGIRLSGVDPIRIHDLRHSHASFLLNNGANIIAVSKRLGHATITQTLETYAHLMNDTEEKMMEIIENKSILSPKH